MRRVPRLLGRSVGYATLVTVLASCAAPPPPVSVRTRPSTTVAATPTPAVTTAPATVVRVFDADSIEMLFQDQRVLHVQLAGVDAPDARAAWRGRANAFVRARLRKGRTVFLEVGPDLWDDHGRYLAYVWLARPTTPDVWEAPTRMLNAILLVDGYAKVERGLRNPKYGSIFHSLERTAKSAGRGVWS